MPRVRNRKTSTRLPLLVISPFASAEGPANDLPLAGLVGESICNLKFPSGGCESVERGSPASVIVLGQLQVVAARPWERHQLFGSRHSENLD